MVARGRGQIAAGKSSGFRGSVSGVSVTLRSGLFSDSRHWTGIGLGALGEEREKDRNSKVASRRDGCTFG
jgi:hypothetical protein